MRKRPLFFWRILLLFSAYTACTTIKTNQNLFQEISVRYPIKEYDIVLHTQDSILVLKNPRVVDKGMLEVESAARNKKQMHLYTNKTSGQLMLKDTLNNDSLLQLTQEEIKKVDVREDIYSNTLYTVYDKGKAVRSFGYVLGMTTLIIIGSLLLLYALFDSVEVGCYIATMVYGSYDAPEVVVLRKFRDEKLSRTLAGRLLIKLYYSTSPAFVYIFKNNEPVNRWVRSILDRWVQKLKNEESQALAQIDKRRCNSKSCLHALPAGH